MNTNPLENIPAQDNESARKLGEDLAASNPATLRRWIELVGDDFGDPSGTKSKYALHGLTHYVSRPGAEADRKRFAQTLAEELSADHSDELKAFLVRQLQMCGRSAEVPALAKLLSSNRLCNPASQALASIGGSLALKSLRDALSSAEGWRRAAISHAIAFISQE